MIRSCHSSGRGPEMDEPGSLRPADGPLTRAMSAVNAPRDHKGRIETFQCLDLVYNPNGPAVTIRRLCSSRRQGANFIVDDLGRQAEPPASSGQTRLDPCRWRKARISLPCNRVEKFEVPFEIALVVFSDQLPPQLRFFRSGRAAPDFLQDQIDGPNQENLLKIFALVGAQDKACPLDEGALVHLLKVNIPTTINVYANYQPVFLIDHDDRDLSVEGIPNQDEPCFGRSAHVHTCCSGRGHYQVTSQCGQISSLGRAGLVRPVSDGGLENVCAAKAPQEGPRGNSIKDKGPRVAGPLAICASVLFTTGGE